MKSLFVSFHSEKTNIYFKATYLENRTPSCHPHQPKCLLSMHLMLFFGDRSQVDGGMGPNWLEGHEFHLDGGMGSDWVEAWVADGWRPGSHGSMGPSWMEGHEFRLNGGMGPSWM